MAERSYGREELRRKELWLKENLIVFSAYWTKSVLLTMNEFDSFKNFTIIETNQDNLQIETIV